MNEIEVKTAVGALSPVFNKKTNTYTLADFDKIKGNVVSYIEENVNKFNVDSAIKLSEAKELRTTIRKDIASAKDTRLNYTTLLMGDLITQLKELETILTDADNLLKGKIDNYETAELGKVEKQKVITLTIKGYDASKIEELKMKAISLGLRAEVKM